MGSIGSWWVFVYLLGNDIDMLYYIYGKKMMELGVGY